MSGKRPAVVYAILAAVFAALAAVGSFFDLDISRALYHQDDIPMHVLTIAGQYVFFAAFVFFDGALCRQAVCARLSKGKTAAYCAICVYLALSTSTIGSAALLHYECFGCFFPGTDFSFLFVLLFGLIFKFPMFIVGFAVSPKVYDKALVKRLISVLVFITVTAVAISLLKMPFMRPRYRYTLPGYEGVDFMPWYSCFGSSSGLTEATGLIRNSFESFPSGHAIMGISSIYIFPALSCVLPRLRGKENALFTVGLIYGLAVMLSRIVLGAHYLTDVSIGSLIVSASLYVINSRTHRTEPGSQ